MKENENLMTVSERIERMKRSAAYSPEDAALRVKSMAETEITEMWADKVKNNIAPSSWDAPTYAEFCATVADEVEKSLSRPDKSPYESKFGNSTADKILALTFDLTEVPVNFQNAAPPIYYNTRMRLGEYLDALIGISVAEDGSVDAARVRKYRELKDGFPEELLGMPLCSAVRYISDKYSDPRSELGRADHVISCYHSAVYTIEEQDIRADAMGFFDPPDDDDYYYSCDDEDNAAATAESSAVGEVCVSEEALDEVPAAEELSAALCVDDDDEDYRAYFEDTYDIQMDQYQMEHDPFGYYLEQAEKTPLGHRQFLLVEDFSPAALKAKADEEDMSPAFRKLVDRYVTEEHISEAFEEIDKVVSELYRLIVEPFVELDKYHFANND
ncbi:MAG: hypothetical protein NC299_15465 [Lachnospiraceae bacterium]|nr:hypothetical protein [Ruminococcus sp.]MCM1276732.1 hypothetical protein [Lachnospiraceae bacterium]